MNNYKLTLAIAGIVGTTSVHANTLALEEVIVTAQKRAEGLQDVPISLQAIDGAALASGNHSRLEDISDQISNVIISRSSTNPRIYVRGIGSDSNAGFEQSVAMFSDGIYMGRGQQAQLPLVDIQRVEVLKGPQGTLFGKNATAGAINIVSNDPGEAFEGYVRIAAGEYGDYTSHAVFSGPLNENWGGRIALYGRQLDGFMTNHSVNQNEERKSDFGARATISWSDNESIVAKWKIESGRFTTDGNNYQVTYDPRYADALSPLMGEGGLDFDKRESNDARPELGLTALKGSQPVSNETDLLNTVLDISFDRVDYRYTSITTLSQYQWANNFDADFSNLPIAFQGREEDFSQISQEIRVSSDLSGPLNFLAGVYLQKNALAISTYSALDASLLGAPVTAGALDDFDQTSTTSAVFGQMDWQLSSSLNATLGMRWGTESKSVDNILVTGLWDLTPSATGDFIISRVGGAAHDLHQRREENHLSPLARLAWDANENTLYYISLSRGYKGGGFDGSGLNGSVGTIADESFEYDEESVNALELGGKHTLLDGTARLNWALYHSAYKDLQVSTFNGTGFIISNAGEAEVQGIEGDFTWQASESFKLGTNVAYLDFEWTDFDNAPCTVEQENSWDGVGDCVQDLTGKRGALTPELTASVRMEYLQPLTEMMVLNLGASANYVSEYATESDLDDNLMQPAYTKFDVRIALEHLSGSWDLALIGKNITNEVTTSAGNDNPLIDYAYRRKIDLPRQWSLQGVWRF